MSDTTVVDVKFTATGVEEVKAAHEEAGKAARAHGEALGDQGKAARGAHKEHESLLDKLIEFKREQVAQARTARFFSSELLSIVPAGAQVKGTLSSLLQIGLEGFTLGGAIEAAKYALELFAEELERTEKKELDLRAASLALGDGIRDAMRNVERGIGVELSATSTAWQAQADALRAQVRTIQHEIDRQAAKMANPGTWASIVGTAKQFAQALVGTDQRRKVMDSATGKSWIQAEGDLPGTEALRDAQEKQLKLIETFEAMSREKERVAKKEQEQIERETAQKIADLHAANASKITQIRTALNARLLELAKQKDKLDPEGSAGGNYDRLVAAERAKAREEERRARVDEEQRSANALLAVQKPFLSEYGSAIRENDLKVAALREQMRRTDDAKERSHLEEQVSVLGEQRLAAERALAIKRAQIEIDLNDNLESYRKERRDKEIETANRLFDLWKTKVENISSALDPMFSALGSGFAALTTHAKNFSQVFSNVLRETIQALTQWAAKTVATYALSAEGAAFFSQAGIPIVGPVLAIGAATAAAAFFSALAGQIPSARGGWDIPSGVNPVTQLHEREMVLPAQYADVIRGLQSGGGAPIEIHLHGTDGPSMRRMVESQDFRDAVREAVRNGRL